MIVESHNSSSSMILNCFVFLGIWIFHCQPWGLHNEKTILSFLLLDNIYTIEDKCSLIFAFNLFTSLLFFVVWQHNPSIKEHFEKENTNVLFDYNHFPCCEFSVHLCPLHACNYNMYTILNMAFWNAFNREYF